MRIVRLFGVEMLRGPKLCIAVANLLGGSVEGGMIFLDGASSGRGAIAMCRSGMSTPYFAPGK